MKPAPVIDTYAMQNALQCVSKRRNLTAIGKQFPGSFETVSKNLTFDLLLFRAI